MDTCQGFLSEGRHRRELFLGPDRRLHHRAHVAAHQHQDDRERKQRGYRQGGVHPHHDGERVGQIQRRIEKGQDARPQQHAHGADVVDQARHEVAGSLVLVVSLVQLEKVVEEVTSQVVLYIASGVEDQDA